jgi:hypothetical protein
MQLFEEFYDKQNGQPMSDVQRKFMQQLIDTAMEESL